MKIAGSDINIEHPDIKGKNIQDLKKLDIFSHLSKEDQDKAYAELYNAICANAGTFSSPGGNYKGNPALFGKDNHDEVIVEPGKDK